MARAVTVEQILDEAARLAEDHEGTRLVACFDADGTLWSGDLGEAAFDHAHLHDVVDEDTVRGPIARFLADYDLGIVDDGPRTVERTLALVSAALLDGRFEEAGARRGRARDETLADVYMMQTWCYAGRTLDALRAYGQRVFDDHIARTVFAHTRPLLHGLADRGFALAVVTASPFFLVEHAVSSLCPPGTRLLGMSTAVDDGRVLPRAGTCVYGPGKARAIARAFGEGAPALAFGDTVAGGDREMLRAARLPVAVRPKGAHRAAADAWDTLLLLES